MIPVFKGDGLFGGARDFLDNPGKFTLKHEPELGDFYHIRLPLRRLYVTTNPDVIRHVLQTHHRNYVKSPAYRQLKLALGNGLVTSEGDYWFRQRRLAQPSFYKAALHGIFEKMILVAEKFCNDLAEKRGQTLDVAQAMMQVTSDIVLKALFDVEDSGDKAKMYRQMVDAQEYLIYRTSHPLMIPFTYINGKHRRFLKDKQDFDTMVYRFIEQNRKAAEPQANFINMLLQAKDADTGETMTDLQIRDEAITFFAAGHETSANALTWTLFLLSRHPEIVAKLRQEIKEIVGEKTPQFVDLQRLQYTRQVIEEAMRLYPPAHAVGREAKTKDEILGEKIVRKSIIFISIYAMHHSRRYWENPEKFDPDRFAPERAKNIPKFAYMPFGAGPRMCIGEHFAVMEMQLLLAMLLQRFDFELMEKIPVDFQALVTLKPINGMKMRVRLR